MAFLGMYWGEENAPRSADNGLTAREEREYRQAYDEKVRRLRAQGPEGKRRAREFINEEHRKFVAWDRKQRGR